MPVTRYVLALAFDPSLEYVVGITKKRGPAFLLGRVCFPGGHVEEGETPAEAVAREMREETDVDIPQAAWQQTDFVAGDGYELTTFAAVSPRVFQARAQEDEPVWQLRVASHREYARRQPDCYAPDFLDSLACALQACQPTA